MPMKSDREFETEHDVRTLIDAGKIKKDKPRMKRAMAEARRQKVALNEVAK